MSALSQGANRAQLESPAGQTIQTKNWHNIPNGGTPNIYKINVDTVSPDITKKKKEYSAADNIIVPVKEILAKRRHVTPFFNFDENPTE
jgi:hypothetical protein